MAQCKLAVKKVAAAWKFDLGVMHWAHPEGMDGPFTAPTRFPLARN
jgi:hypothetical protein